MGFCCAVSSPRCSCEQETLCTPATSKRCEAHAARTSPAAAAEEGALLRSSEDLEHNNCIHQVHTTLHARMSMTQLDSQTQ
jgi:hypothetical protein